MEMIGSKKLIFNKKGYIPILGKCVTFVTFF